MSRGPHSFRKRVVSFAVRAAEAAGLPVDIKFDPRSGDIVIRTMPRNDTATDVPAGEPVPPEEIVL